MTNLEEIGVNEQLANRLTEAFKSSLRDKLDEENVAYDESDIEDATETFTKHWVSVCQRKPEDQWRLEQLLDELQSPADYGNVGIILGMASVHLPADHPVSQLVGKQLERKYR